jgi:uncharacterized membrane protein YidH (DUF202 family)
MRALKTVVVAVVLAAMFSPASRALANTEPRTAPVTAPSAPLAETLARAASTLAASGFTAATDEASQYAQRERQSQDVQNFKGGAVYVYFGSGLVLVLVIVLLILIL